MQAAPEIACQWASNPIHPLLAKIARGSENQRLKQ
jgi:hypothetical protein